MQYFKNYIFYFFLLISCFSFSQKLKTIKPVIGSKNEYSLEKSQVWDDIMVKYDKINSGEMSYDSLTKEDLALVDSLEMGSGPISNGVGCSWYCGGEMTKVVSKSFLKTTLHHNYKPENIHDFNLLTAWVVDGKTKVIGTKIDFHFKPLSPRVNELIIYNGYLKNINLWKENARVKKFKLYINSKLYAVLDLEDTTASQSFEIEPVRSNTKDKDLIITLEILEIYEGTKYKDVAVAEINFNGLDVH